MDLSDRAYLDQMFREMYGKLLQYAYANMDDASLSEDAVQESFQVAARKIGVLRSSDNPKGWMLNTLKNVLRDYKRQQARQSLRILSTGDDEPPDTEEGHSPREDEDSWLNLMYGGLVSDEDFELLKLVYVRRFSLQDAAEHLGIGEEACKKRLQRARLKMKEALEDSELP